METGYFAGIHGSYTATRTWDEKNTRRTRFEKRWRENILFRSYGFSSRDVSWRAGHLNFGRDTLPRFSSIGPGHAAFDSNSELQQRFGPARHLEAPGGEVGIDGNVTEPAFGLRHQPGVPAGSLGPGDRVLERGQVPAAVEFLCLGENWVGCGATFPIHMGRAFGLARPIERRFDWMNPDWSPMLMDAEVVDQNLEMPEHIRLFVYKTAEGGPTCGRYVAQFWEGMRGIMDPPHVVEVDFPPASVMESDLMGWPICRARGLIEYPQQHFHGRMTMQVGCGAHTTHHATVAMADHTLSLEDFRTALLAGGVEMKPE